LNCLLLRSFLGLGLQFFIVGLVLQTARDLLNQPSEVTGRLRSNCLDVSLENQEVARSDENVLRLQSFVVLLGSHNSVVDAVLADALTGY
jgi:hypothetical protein